MKTLFFAKNTSVIQHVGKNIKKHKLLSGLFLILLLLIALVLKTVFAKSDTKLSYQTTIVEKGTLITSISATGSITSGNATNISTKASGTVTKVYVKNGDEVKKGQKILDITLDSDGVERKSNAYQAYLKAQEDVVAKLKEKQDLSVQVWKDRQAITDAQELQKNMNDGQVNPSTKEVYTDDERHQVDEAVIQKRLAFDVTAASFSNSDSQIQAAKIVSQAAYNDYLDVSGSIIAPVSGILNNLTLTVGSTLSASSSQSTTTGSSYANSQTIGFIRSSNNQYQAKVSLTEVDVTKVSAGQKVVLTLDAYADKTFTGKVLAVDVSGSSSSGVTSYPATILMDATDTAIYPNMSVSATIIIDSQTDVLIVPTSAITKNSDETSTVQIMKDGKPETVIVEVGSKNDTQTAILSGLSEGQEVISASLSTAKNNNTTSVFSSSNKTNIRSGSASFQMIGGPPGF